MPRKVHTQPNAAGWSILAALARFFNPLGQSSGTVPGAKSVEYDERRYGDEPVPHWQLGGKIYHPSGEKLEKAIHEIEKAKKRTDKTITKERKAQKQIKKHPPKPPKAPKEKKGKLIPLTDPKSDKKPTENYGGSQKGYWKGNNFYYESQYVMPRRYMRGRKKTYRKRYTPRGDGLFGAGKMLTEVKYVDNNWAATAVDDIWNVTAINLLQQGTSFTTRVGNSVKFVRITWRFTIEDNTSDDNVHRFVIFLDKQPNGALATDANLFQYPVSVSPIACVNSPLNLGNSQRFQICRDKILTTQKSNNSVAVFKGSCRIACRTQYMANNGTIADISTNALLLGFVSIYGVGQSAGNQISGYARCRFTDD